MKTSYVLFRLTQTSPGIKSVRDFWFTYSTTEDLFDLVRLEMKMLLERDAPAKIASVEIFFNG